MLLEIGSSRKLLCCMQDTLVGVVEEELKLMGDVSLLPFNPADLPATSKAYYILQRWSDKWQAFIDVKEASEVSAGDHLTVVPCPKPAATSSVSLL